MTAGNEISVSVVSAQAVDIAVAVAVGDTLAVTDGPTVGVAVAGAAGDALTLTNGPTVEVSVSGTAPVGDTLTVTNGSTASISVTSVGDRGPKGDTGPATTLTVGTVTGGATAAATLTGAAPNQTLNLVLPQGATGATGKNIELQASATHLQWRNVGDTAWNNLVALTAITGPQGSVGATGAAGSNGSSVELQTTSTHIQWRLVGGSTWTNLVALTAITGAQGSTGATGSTGPAGPANTLTIGTITTGAAGSSASAAIAGTAPNQTLSLTIPRGDKGQDGADVEFQSSATHLQWRYVGGTTWTNLVALSAITGPQGTTGAAGANGSSVELQATATHIQWRLIGGSTWTDLVALSAITGPQGTPGTNGTNVELQATATHLQWRYVGGSAWTDLVPLANITGPQGSAGQQGEPGAIQWLNPPASPLSLSGVAGDVARDAGYIYVCNGPGEWKRAAVSTWAPVDPYFSNVKLLLHYAGSFADSSSSARTPAVNGSVTFGGNGRFGGHAIFNNSTYWNGATRAYLQYAYDADWDLGNQFTIEFWVFGRPVEEDPFRLILGTAGWGAYITQQSEQDYGTDQRVEIVKFNSSGNVVSRADCGPIAENQWNYYGISSVAIKSGTQPGGAFTHVNTNNFGLVYGLDALSSPLTIGGNSVNRGYIGSMDEVRITKGVNRVPAFVPDAQFPDA
jgi:hypothetical protein